MNSRVKRLAAILAVMTVAGWPAGTRTEADFEQYIFKSFDYPGAAITWVYGINARGDVVGAYQDGNKVNHGFLREGGKFTTIELPGSDAVYSIATAIGPAGDIVGYYGVAAGATTVRGFLLDKHGEWETIPNFVAPPPTMTPSPMRILPDGTMVGCFHYAGGSMHGFILSPDGAFASFDYPAGASNAMHYGATPDAKTIVGVYTQSGVTSGYILNDGVFVRLHVPGSVRTTPQDINAGAIVVGSYRNPGESANVSHGFVLRTRHSLDTADWEYMRPVDFPGSSATRIRGVNSRGDIVGDYTDSGGNTHGFVGSTHWPRD